MIARNPLDKARRDLETARSKHARWEAEVGTARQELADLQAREPSELVDATDPSAAASAAAAQASGIEGRIRSAAGATAEAARRCDAARAEAVHAAAGVLAGKAKAALKAAEVHAAKVDKLRSELEELDGCGYERTPSARGLDGEPVAWNSRTFELQGEAQRLADRADQLTATASGNGTISDAQVDAALAEADPDGPEAQTAAQRDQARQDRDQAQAQHRERDRKLREARRVALSEVGLSGVGGFDRDAFIAKYAKGAMKVDRLSHDEAAKQATARADELEADVAATVG